MSLARREQPRRSSRARYGPAIISGVALIALLTVGRMARSKFEWWQQAAFSGVVVGKEARSRTTGEPVGEAAVLKSPSQCRFYLFVRGQEGVSTHEVVLKLFATARAGDLVAKDAGTYKWECVPGAPALPPEDAAENGQ